MNLNKKEEGKLEQIPDSEQVVVKIDNEVPKKLDKIEKDDKKSFEDFKNLYKGVIDMKCNQDYGTIEDKDLWEDCAKELFLKSKTYLLKGDEYKPEKLEKKVESNSNDYKSGDVVDILGSYGKWLNSSDRTKYVIDRPATKEEIAGIWDIDTPCYIVKTIGMTDDTKFLNGTSKEPITRLRHAIYKSKEHKMNEATIDDKATILEALVDFLNDNNITADNIVKNKDLVEKYLSDNKLGISAYIPTVYKVAKDDYGTIGRIIFYRSKSEWGFNTSSIVIESNKINESFDLDLIEKNIKGKRLSDAARYLGALVNGDRNSFEIQGSELVSKLNSKDKVMCTIEGNDIIKSIVKDFTHLTDKTESLNKTCKNESFEIKSGDKFINENGAMITVLEPTNTGKLQFKVTNTINGKEGTNVYISNSLEKVLKDNGYTKIEESEEEITPANIKEKALKILPKEDVDVRDSDLYIKVSDKSKELINKLQFKNNGLLTTFRSPIDNEMWYDIPFANLEDYITSIKETLYDYNPFEELEESKDISKDISNDRLQELLEYAIEWISDHIDPDDMQDMLDDLSINENQFEDPSTIDQSKLNSILTKALEWITYHTSDEKDTFKRQLGLKKKELDYFGIDLEESLQESKEYTKVEENKLKENNTNLEYKYMLLDRLKQDCKYFLGNGNGNAKHSLWAKDIDEQIEKMKEIYNSFSEEEKPDWITLEDIDNFEKRMKEYNKDIKTEDLSDKDKFLAHILNGVIKDIQSRFDVEAVAEFTKDEDEIVIYIRGNTLDLIDATSYLAKTIRRDDVDFEFDENISDNTIKCYVAPKNLDKSKAEESIVSNYTLSEINKVLSSNGNDFTMKISNSNIDTETKYLDIDREDLISIYNVLGGNKDELTESRPDKERARAFAFAGSRRRLQLPKEGLVDKEDIIMYLQKCQNQIDIMNVNNAIKNTELRNKLLTTGFDFAKSVNIVDDHIDEFKNAMIKATQDYFQNIKTESREGYQDKCCMCGTSNLNGCYSVLDEEGNVGSVCVDCGKKYSLPEIEKKINSDMKSEYMHILKDIIGQGKLTEADSYKDPELMKRYNITKIYNSESEVPYEIAKYKFGTERYVSLEHYNKLLDYCKNLIDLDVIDQHCANSIWDTSFESEAVTLTNSFYLNEIAKEYKIETKIILQLELEHTELFLKEHSFLGGNLIYFYKPSFIEVRIKAGSESSFMIDDKLRSYKKFSLDQLNDMKSFIISENKRIASNVDPDDNHNRAGEEHAEAIAHNTLYNN